MAELVSSSRTHLRLSLMAMLAGALFAVSLIPVWNLSTRWFAVVVVGLLLISVSFVLVRRLDDLLLAASLLFLPLASIQKWLFLEDYPERIKNVAVLSGAISVGLTELLLVGAYALWFLQVVTRAKPVPRLTQLDFVIGLYVVATVLSLQNAADIKLSLFAVAHLIRHVLVYFYFSRRLTARHLPWVLAAFALAIAGESLLGVLQYRTGILSGIILDKGAGSPDLKVQYEVPGIENVTRATGTSYDSHSYGLFLVMLLPFPLTLLLSARTFLVRERATLLALVGLGTAGVFVSFSRSSWLTLPIAGLVVYAAMVMRREKQLAIKTGILLMLALLAAPRVVQSIMQRFDNKGTANLTARFDQYPVAWEMWKEHLLVGQGVGSYMVILDHYRPDESLNEPVHNVFLWLAADTGVLGATMFYAVIVVAMLRLLKLLSRGRAPTDLWALAALAALTAYVIDGLTNPLFRESLVYMLFWFMVALSVALPRIQAEIDLRQPLSGR